MTKNRTHCCRCKAEIIEADRTHANYCRTCWRAYQAEYRKSRSKPPEARPCAHCGKVFTPANKGTRALYCSPSCKGSAKHYRDNPRIERSCPSCGADLTDRRAGVVWCSPSCRERERRRQTPRKVRRDDDLRRNYGITHDDYDRMLAAQQGGCAICGRPELESRFGVLVVDHDHSSGAVRSLLCNDCNLGIGKLADDPNRLRAAADYLDRFNKA